MGQTHSVYVRNRELGITHLGDFGQALASRVAQRCLLNDANDGAWVVGSDHGDMVWSA
jgi:hypothetical protein